MTKKNRVVRALEQNAKKGDISSMFQLYKDCSGVQKYEEASVYFGQCIEFLNTSKTINGVNVPINKFTFDELNLIDFRKFEALTIKLEKNLTVLIGENGAGKTSIVDSITKGLSWIVAGIEKDSKNGFPVKYSEIRNKSQHYSDVNIKLSFGVKSHFNGRISRAVAGAKEKRDSSVTELKFLAEIWRVVNVRQEINLPVFAFYSVERSHSKPASSHSSEKILNTKRQSRFDAYVGALGGAGKFENFIEWFVALHKKAKDDKLDQLERLKKQVEKLETVISDEDDSLQSILDIKREEYQQAVEQSLVTKGISDAKQRDIVVSAITAIVPSVGRIWVETKSGYDEVIVENDHVEINLAQLSDGQRVFTALVGDLARRMVMLNPNLSNPLEGQGVVLIDEIELHLHPKWQQDIIPSLQNTFPNIQLIVTTHSPQVLSTVDKSCIRKFIEYENGDIIAEPPKFQTKGVKSADILSKIMGTTSTPDVEEARQVDEFSNLLLNGAREDAEKLLGTLIKHFGNEHLVIEDCRNQIKIFEMKERVRKRKDARGVE